MWAIIKKEVKSYFYSPVGYIFIGAFLLLSSVFFNMFLKNQGIVEYTGLFMYGAELLTFSIAFLTMGMFATERKNGTEMLLFTSSKSMTSIVLGKFLAALVVIVVTEILSLLYYAIFCYFAGGLIEVVPTLVMLGGFLLLSLVYISFGGFMSSLTENQIISAIATVVLLVATWFLPNITEVLVMLSPIYAFQNFLNGVVSISDTIVLLSQFLLFTLLTITVLQRRRNLK